MGLQDELVGTFELVALESRRSDGEITHPYGEQPIGLFVFDATGRYSVQLTDPDRRRDESSMELVSRSLSEDGPTLADYFATRPTSPFRRHDSFATAA